MCTHLKQSATMPMNEVGFGRRFVMPLISTSLTGLKNRLERLGVQPGLHRVRTRSGTPVTMPCRLVLLWAFCTAGLNGFAQHGSASMSREVKVAPVRGLTVIRAAGDVRLKSGETFLPIAGSRFFMHAARPEKRPKVARRMFPGEILRCAGGAYCDLYIHGHGVVRVAGETLLTIPDDVAAEGQDPEASLELQSGTLFLDVKPPTDPRNSGALRILTPKTGVTVVGTQFFIRPCVGGECIGVWQGDVRVDARHGAASQRLKENWVCASDGKTLARPRQYGIQEKDCSTIFRAIRAEAVQLTEVLRENSDVRIDAVGNEQVDINRALRVHVRNGYLLLIGVPRDMRLDEKPGTYSRIRIPLAGLKPDDGTIAVSYELRGEGIRKVWFGLFGGDDDVLLDGDIITCATQWQPIGIVLDVFPRVDAQLTPTSAPFSLGTGAAIELRIMHDGEWVDKDVLTPSLELRHIEVLRSR